MCFFSVPKPKIETKAAPAPERDPNAGLSQLARLNAFRARGARDTIATSPLGDPGFGTNLKRATLLGQTSA